MVEALDLLCCLCTSVPWCDGHGCSTWDVLTPRALMSWTSTQRSKRHSRRGGGCRARNQTPHVARMSSATSVLLRGWLRTVARRLPGHAEVSRPSLSSMPPSSRLNLNPSLCSVAQAARQVARRLPGVQVRVFSDRDVTARPAELAAALDGADVFFASLLFDYDQARPPLACPPMQPSPPRAAVSYHEGAHRIVPAWLALLDGLWRGGRKGGRGSGRASLQLTLLIIPRRNQTRMDSPSARAAGGVAARAHPGGARAPGVRVGAGPDGLHADRHLPGAARALWGGALLLLVPSDGALLLPNQPRSCAVHSGAECMAGHVCGLAG